MRIPKHRKHPLKRAFARGVVMGTVICVPIAVLTPSATEVVKVEPITFPVIEERIPDIEPQMRWDMNGLTVIITEDYGFTPMRPINPWRPTIPSRARQLLEKSTH